MSADELERLKARHRRRLIGTIIFGSIVALVVTIAWSMKEATNPVVQEELINPLASSDPVVAKSSQAVIPEETHEAVPTEDLSEVLPMPTKIEPISNDVSVADSNATTESVQEGKPSVSTASVTQAKTAVKTEPSKVKVAKEEKSAKKTAAKISDKVEKPKTVDPVKVAKTPAQTQPTKKLATKPTAGVQTANPQKDTVKSAPHQDLTAKEVLLGKLPNDVHKASASKSLEPTQLQVGAFDSEAKAKVRQAEVSKLGYSAKIIPVTTANGVTMYRVRIPFSSRDEAKLAEQKIKAARIDTYLVSK